MKQKRSIVLKIIAGLIAAAAGLLSALLLIAGSPPSLFHLGAWMGFGLCIAAIFVKKRSLSIIFVSVGGGITIIMTALFGFVIWFVGNMW